MNLATREGLRYVLDQMTSQLKRSRELREVAQQEVDRHSGEIAELERRVREIEQDLAS